MDKVRAERFASELKEQTCFGWILHDYINSGKSAIVLKATRGNEVAAIKIFDPELVERCGVDVELARIDREKSLIGKSHPNLIQILDGGFWEEHGAPFIAMEFLPWKNLADVLAEVPVGQERAIIAQIASAARFLEILGICHRDIKPENIGISPDFQNAKLLDLGVIKPQGMKSVTDGTHTKAFLGTSKYAPPEFLLRKELDTPEAWRAVTFYQLGGVLHDLIVRRSLFADYESPPAVLYNTVQSIRPVIECKSVSAALIELAQDCLLKKPELRLQLVTWDLFEREPTPRGLVADIKAKVLRRRIAKQDAIGAAHPANDALQTARDRLDAYTNDIVTTCRLECVGNRDVFPPIEIQPHSNDDQVFSIVMQFDPSSSHDLSLFFRIEIYLRWVDPQDDVIDVSVAAFISQRQFGDNIPIGQDGMRVYHGAYVAESVHRNVLTAVYRALAKAHEANVPDKAGTQPYQLELKEELI